jgi:hypothetical protein
MVSPSKYTRVFRPRDSRLRYNIQHIWNLSETKNTQEDVMILAYLTSKITQQDFDEIEFSSYAKRRSKVLVTARHNWRASNI